MRITAVVPKVNGLRVDSMLLEADNALDERILGALTALAHYGGQANLHIGDDWEFEFILANSKEVLDDADSGE